MLTRSGKNTSPSAFMQTGSLLRRISAPPSSGQAGRFQVSFGRGGFHNQFDTPVSASLSPAQNTTLSTPVRPIATPQQAPVSTARRIRFADNVHGNGGPVVPRQSTGVEAAVRTSVSSNIRNRGPPIQGGGGFPASPFNPRPVNLLPVFAANAQHHRTSGDPSAGLTVTPSSINPSVVYVTPSARVHSNAPVASGTRSNMLQNQGTLNFTQGMNPVRPASGNETILLGTPIQPGLINVSNVPVGVHPKSGTGYGHGSYHTSYTGTPGSAYVEKYKDPVYPELPPPPRPSIRVTNTGYPELVTSQGIPMRNNTQIQFEL